MASGVILSILEAGAFSGLVKRVALIEQHGHPAESCLALPFWVACTDRR